MIPHREKARVRWMTQVFEKAKKDAQLIKYISTKSFESKDNEVAKEIEHLRELENDIACFFHRITSSESKNGIEYLISDEERDEALQEFSDELKQNFKTICLKRKSFEDEVHHRSIDEAKWSSVLKDFLFYLEAQASLLTSEEEKKEVLIQNKLAKKTTLQKQLRDEQETLEQQCETREFNSTQIAGKTAKLKKDVKSLKSRLEVQLKILKQKEKKFSDLDQSHSKRIADLDKKKEDLSKAFASLKEQHEVQESEVRKKLKRSKNELNELSTECSTEMIQLSQEMFDAIELEKRTLEEMNELKKKVDPLTEARDKIEAEEEKLRKEKEMKDKQLSIAATQVQAQFRGWRTRKNLKAKKGKGKKGKGKKKGKKGK